MDMSRTAKQTKANCITYCNIFDQLKLLSIILSVLIGTAV